MTALTCFILGDTVSSPSGVDLSLTETAAMLEGLHGDDESQVVDPDELRALVADATSRVMAHAHRGDAPTCMNGDGGGDGNSLVSSDSEEPTEKTPLAPQSKPEVLTQDKNLWTGILVVVIIYCELLWYLGLSFRVDIQVIDVVFIISWGDEHMAEQQYFHSLHPEKSDTF